MAVQVPYIKRIMSCGCQLHIKRKGYLMLSVMDPLNLVLLIIVAIVAWRLWGVLGTRTGLEKPPIVFTPTMEKTKSTAAEPALQGEILEPEGKKPIWFGHATEGSEIAPAHEGHLK